MSNLFNSRDEILGVVDFETKELTVPEHIPGWGGRTLRITQLSRGDQDDYLKRQYGTTRMKQEVKRNKNLPQSQEISAFNFYGHDAFLCVRGICDATGTRLFKDSDEELLKKKNGEAIGWIASEIIKHSGMELEAKAARGEISEEEALEQAVKNS